jgi:hypothetical protein
MLLGFLAVIFALPSAALAGEPGTRQRTFVRALEVFDAARTSQDYRESAALLESLLADGFRNGAVYYNLGNAYFRAGEYGRSIALAVDGGITPETAAAVLAAVRAAVPAASDTAVRRAYDRARSA